MRKAFIYKAVIDKKTEAKCLRWLELCRSLYNACLEQRIDAWNRCRVSISGYDQAKELPALKQQFPEYGTVGSQCLQDVIERLDRAYRAFFRRLRTGEEPGFPRFKGKDRYDSFTLKQAGWKLEGRYLHISNVGRFKLFLSRPIEGVIKTVTVRRASAGKWFVIFSCDEVPAREFPEPVHEAVGLDMGIKAFLFDSDGNSVLNPQFFRKAEQVLRRLQRSLSRKKKGSNRRKKAKVLVAKTHEKLRDRRKDFCHKTAFLYVTAYAMICVEDLRIRNMVRNRHLAKSIGDSAWGIFLAILSVKAAEAGRTYVRVPPHGTSRICSRCWADVAKNLSVRLHKCPHCGLVMDRDHNAAINIKRAGLALQAPTVAMAAVA